MFEEIDLRLKPSFFLSGLIAFLFFLVMLLIGSRDIHPILSLPLLVTLLGVGLYYIKLFGLLNLNKSIKGITLSQKVLCIKHMNGQSTHTNLLSSSFITPWFCLLVFASNTETSNFHIVLLCKKNTVDQEQFRRFRVWSKFSNTLLNSPQIS